MSTREFVRLPGIRRLGAFLVAFALIVPRSAYGYVDPLSGSVILQVLAAGVLAALFQGKRLWLGFIGIVRRVWARIAR